MEESKQPQEEGVSSAVERVAVVMIHGMGEQRPMDTLREFVETVWQRDHSLFDPENIQCEGADKNNEPTPDYHANDIWSKPDWASGSSELRRLTTAREGSRQAVRADFFELHWADLTSDNKWSDFLSWLRRLLFRNPFKGAVPRRILFPWVLAWLLVLVIVISSALTFITAMSGAGLGDVFPESVVPEYIVAWEFWIFSAAIVGILGGGAKLWLTAYFGDVSRYVWALPRNIQVRKQARQRGVALLDALTIGGKYHRIVVVGHSLGSILAHDIIALYWAKSVHELSMASNSNLFAKVDACEKAAKDLLECSGYVKSGFTDGPRGSLNKKSKPTEPVYSSDYEDKLADFRCKQRDLFRELSLEKKRVKVGAPGSVAPAWLISDLITVGSPLTHAEFLLASNRDELHAMVVSGEMLRCPPVMKSVKDEPRFLFQPSLSIDDWRLRYSAAFAATRWTNIYDESGAYLFFLGDLISGPLRRDFGPGIFDIGVKVWRKTGWLRVIPRLFTHTRYWKYKKCDGSCEVADCNACKTEDCKISCDGRGGAPDHILLLRRALNLHNDEKAEKALLVQVIAKRRVSTS